MTLTGVSRRPRVGSRAARWPREAGLGRHVAEHEGQGPAVEPHEGHGVYHSKADDRNVEGEGRDHGDQIRVLYAMPVL
jgi:hypothetical protein